MATKETIGWFKDQTKNEEVTTRRAISIHYEKSDNPYWIEIKVFDGDEEPYTLEVSPKDILEIIGLSLVEE